MQQVKDFTPQPQLHNYVNKYWRSGEKNNIKKAKYQPW